MASEIRIPGPEIPAIPAIACSVPDDWNVHEAPGALATFVPGGANGVSVQLRVTRVGTDLRLRDVAVRSFARQRRAHRSVTIDSQRVGRFGERVVYVRGVTVRDDAATAQVHGLFFGPAGDDRTTADLFSLVGSCPADAIGEYGPVFVDILASISFDGADSEERTPS